MQNNIDAWLNTTNKRLDYLPPKASLITSSAVHPKKTKTTLHVQKQEESSQTTTQIWLLKHQQPEQKPPS